MVHERIRREPEGEEDERGDEHRAAADAVDEDAEDRPCEDADARVRGEHEPRRAKPEVAHVVEVDEGEREHDPVPECVAQAAELQGLHRTRQAWVQAAKPGGHSSDRSRARERNRS